MNENDVLDNYSLYGDKHLFVVVGEFLFIYKGKVIINNELRKIPINNVIDLRYLDGKIEKTIGSAILETVGTILTEGAIFGFGNINRNRLEIDYEVDGELAKGSYDTTLQPGDLEELKKLIKLSLK